MSLDIILYGLTAIFLGVLIGFGMGVGIKITDTVIKHYEKNLWILK